MWKKDVYCLVIGMLIIMSVCHGQACDTAGLVPSEAVSKGFFKSIQKRISRLDAQISQQTGKYLTKMSDRELQLRKALSKSDSTGANSLFNNSKAGYDSLSNMLMHDTGSIATHLNGPYDPFVDSLKTGLSFLRSHPELLPNGNADLEKVSSQLQAIEAKMLDADKIKAYIAERQQQIGDYIKNHAGLPNSLTKQYQGLGQDAYYYAQQIRQYKEDLNDPDKIEKETLQRLSQLPAFQSFFKSHSQLASIFGLPAGYGSSGSLAGLQTRDQVNDLIQGQVSGGGQGAAAALQGNLAAARQKVDDLKNKLNSDGAETPDFKPNGQKTKSFWNRMEYGISFQTTKNNYYFPTTTNLGLSVGYKLNDASVIGVGAEYRLGWGSGIGHVQFSNQGLNLRSFIDIKIKGSFFAVGGFEYSHATPFQSVQDLRQWDQWSKSGLIGIGKTVSVKSRLFKKTKLQLLWDFLSYQQTPQTPPLKFRIAYTF